MTGHHREGYNHLQHYLLFHSHDISVQILKHHSSKHVCNKDICRPDIRTPGTLEASEDAKVSFLLSHHTTDKYKSLKVKVSVHKPKLQVHRTQCQKLLLARRKKGEAVLSKLPKQGPGNGDNQTMTSHLMS